MTEEEARKKWCPMVRFNATGANRWTFADCPDDWEAKDRENPDMARCIASDCMMWRWNKYLEREASSNVAPYNTTIKAPLEQEGGYCGLAK
jgi:hypothetical protein